MRSIFRFCLFIFSLTAVTLPPAFAHGGGHFNPEVSSENQKESISSQGLINSPTASTLGKNHFSTGFQFDYLRYNSIPAADAHALHHKGRDIHGKNHEETYHAGLAYGVLENLDLTLDNPIVSKNSIDIENHRTLGTKEAAVGFGDINLSAKYQFWQKYVEAALLTGIQFPTGKTDDKRKNGGKFPIENQPGSGAWNADFGLALSRSFRQHLSLASSFQYFMKTHGAQDFNAGDEFRLNFGAAYAFRQFGKYPNLSLILEMNHEWALKDHSREEAQVYDSGGRTVYLTPGLSAELTRHISAFAGLLLPIYQNLGGEHEEVTLGLITGVSIGL